jgi:hypothetical protein
LKPRSGRRVVPPAMQVRSVVDVTEMTGMPKTRAQTACAASWIAVLWRRLAAILFHFTLLGPCQ